ncbi:beta-1,6-N-acetylglucosaminyltransferase [Rhodobacter calidifons]|uniref:Peptide O-xylosyltransferase n=1 Tax=Rhodobacter calidifons TaxID=2715277 RepID=A0ABX0G3X9_9RHOB|nr:beta-1,6-N-acetylglucosaminyltransferase [Rhodobacter calidifons]NHB75932.1 beta-1,6-N-acetylglucosaminyltransferase [Rhodobacter calidifons]
MTLGVVMLCHAALDRAAQLARHWASHGCPVVIHVDARAPMDQFEGLQSALADLPDIRFSRRSPCEWGTFGIVQATIDASTQMLAQFPQVSHVLLASGSCLPIRPVRALQAHLAQHPDTDFIESVTTADVGWTVGGLDEERFTLRFPFAWKRQRRLFDGYVALQRALRFRRRLPPGLVPHLGSQWWCLTRATLQAILSHPDRPALDRYFRRVWIPDESYFQSLVRQVSTRIESRSLTLSKFDYQGRPHVFYDDHLHLLRQTDAFLARKIWPKADLLYRTFLTLDGDRALAPEPNPGKINRLFAKAVERRVKGRPGLYMQSRFPTRARGGNQAAAPYGVFSGFVELFDDFQPWLARALDARVHGHLFAFDRAEFAGGESVFKGGLSDSPTLRDYNPRSFLTNLIWNTRGETQCFQFGPADEQAIASFMAGDPNAMIFVITGAFAVPLWRSGRSAAEVRAEAARLQKVESDFIALLNRPDARAGIRIWSLAEFVENPAEPLEQLVDLLNPRATHRVTDLPSLTPLQGFGAFLQDLRNQGMAPVLMGDFPADADLAQPHQAPSRPRIVR